MKMFENEKDVYEVFDIKYYISGLFLKSLMYAWHDFVALINSHVRYSRCIPNCRHRRRQWMSIIPLRMTRR